MPGRRTSVAQVSFAATFELMMEFLNDLPMTVYSLTGFIGGLPSTVNPMMLVRSPFTGNRELQLLVLDEVAVGNALAATRDDAVLHRKLVFRYAESFGRQIEQRLVGIGGRLANVRRSMAKEIEGAAAVRRAIGVSRHDRGDRFEGHAQLFGHNLPVGREGRALAEVALAGANQDRVVGMNLNPGTGERGIERVLQCGGFRGIALQKSPGQPS